MRKILVIICYLFIFIGLESVAMAQITIGVSEPPVAGALLQVKSIENVNKMNANSTKGLMLPRVNLNNMKELTPILPQGYNKSFENPIHTGLLVFNTNNELPNSNGIGVYLWNGEYWKPLTKTRKKE